MLVVWATLLSGCATGPVRWVSQAPPASLEAVERCIALYHALDRHARGQGVVDAGDYRLPGYPYFRSSRFLASFAPELEPASASTLAYRDWLIRMNLLAIEGLALEWQRLPVEAQHKLTAQIEFPLANIEAVQQKLRFCGALLVADISRQPSLKSPLLAAAQVPDHYSSWKRWLGLYPLVSLPFSRGVVQEQAEIRAQQQAFREAPLAYERWRWYRFEKTASGLPPLQSRQVARLVQDLRLDQLGIPQISKRQQAQLLAAWQPNLAVERQGLATDNRVGRLQVEPGRVIVDTERPAIYSYLSYGRFGEAVTLQLNYTFWFSRRPPQKRLDWLAGELDGLTWRVHLNTAGELLAMDAVHNCGCWYQLYPVDPEALTAVAEGHKSMVAEPVLRVPLLGYRPEGWPGEAVSRPRAAGQRLTLFLQADTHMLLGRALGCDRPGRAVTAH